jgi:hypothetical protein
MALAKAPGADSLVVKGGDLHDRSRSVFLELVQFAVGTSPHSKRITIRTSSGVALFRNAAKRRTLAGN